jgi:hypothetical protein
MCGATKNVRYCPKADILKETNPGCCQSLERLCLIGVRDCGGCLLENTI